MDRLRRLRDIRAHGREKVANESESGKTPCIKPSSYPETRNLGTQFKQRQFELILFYILQFPLLRAPDSCHPHITHTKTRFFSRWSRVPAYSMPRMTGSQRRGKRGRRVTGRKEKSNRDGRGRDTHLARLRYSVSPLPLSPTYVPHPPCTPLSFPPARFQGKKKQIQTQGKTVVLSGICAFKRGIGYDKKL
jgi:hypothetical protein